MVEFLLNDEFKWIWKQSWPNMMQYPAILLEGLREVMQPETRVACLPAEI
jgi:hypothetical protein